MKHFEKQPIFKDLVLIGGGHSHAIALKMFGRKPLPGVRLTLITDKLNTPYSGMVPGHIAGFYTYDECHIDLQSLASFAQAQLYVDRVVGLCLENNTVLCAHRPAVAFDVLSVDIGSTPAMRSVPGATEYAIPAKPISKLLENWYQLCRDFKCHHSTSFLEPLSIGVVGGGVGGVELALSMQGHLHRILNQQRGQWGDNSKNAPTSHSQLTNLKIHLFQRQAELMPNYHPSAQHQVQKILLQRGVQLHLGETVCQVEPQTVICESGLTVKCNSIFWVTQASAPEWIRTAGLGTDEQGFILVEDTLQSQTHPHIFATGDIATMANHPRPKAGVFAVRQGKPLFENLQRIFQAKLSNPTFHKNNISV